MYSAPWAGHTLPGTTVTPGMATWAGLRTSITRAAPSSPKRPESVSNRTVSRPAAHNTGVSRIPTAKRSMNPQYTEDSA